MVASNEVVKKTTYDELVAKVNNIDISGFVLKKNSDAEKRFLILVNLLKIYWKKKKDYNVKRSDIESK